LATYFFFNSKKEVGKKMPPRKFEPQALKDSLRSRFSVLLTAVGVKKNSRRKDAAQTIFALIRQQLRCSTRINGGKVKTKINP